MFCDMNMIGTEDLSSCDIQLCSEFLAVVLSECCRNSATQDRSRGNTGSRSGKTLFRNFVKHNSASVWKPTLTDSISTVRFGGFLHDPPTIFLQGSAKHMQSIREAWSSRMLRPPTGYHIDFVGDVTRIGARPLSRDRFIPLSDAVCATIGNLTTQKELATQEAILEGIPLTFPGVQAPNRDTVHDILGKLIRERKIYCTGPGYYLVRQKTRIQKKQRGSGDEENKMKTVSGKDEKNEYGCRKCRETRTSFETEVDMRRSYRVKKRHNIRYQEERTSLCSPTSSVESEGLHGRVIPDNAGDRQLRKNDNRRSSPTKSPYLQRDDIVRSQGGFVEKMANKLFGRKKSCSERRPSDVSITGTPKHIADHMSQAEKKTGKIRQLSPYEARRRGYLNQTEKEMKKHSRKERRESESPVKEVRSDTGQQNKSQRGRKSKNDKGKEETQAKQNSNEREKLKNTEENEHGKRRIRRSKSNSNEHPMKRDVAITCKLENIANETRERVTITPSAPYSGFADYPRSMHNNKRTLRRSKSLGLPRDSQKNFSETKKMERHISITRPSQLPPDYHSLKFTELTEKDFDFQTAASQRTRQSISSTSTSREYSFLHACPLAPSFRIGSAIAEHLQELNQRKCQDIDGRKSPDNLTLSTTSIESRSPSDVDSDNADDSQLPSTGSNKIENENEKKLDAETKAALHIAKRLAMLGVKMTREEWTDYFATKTLPPHAEKLLLENKETKASDRRESPTSCFEDTSGSVETVIDLTSDKYLPKDSESETNHDTKTSEKALTDLPNQKHGEDENSDICTKCQTNFCDIFTSKKTEDYCTHCIRETYRDKKYPCLCRNCHRINDVKGSYLDYSILSHAHLPYCCIHNQYVSIDNASLTEDSGIYSARERSSLSSWDAEKKAHETFV